VPRQSTVLPRSLAIEVFLCPVPDPRVRDLHTPSEQTDSQILWCFADRATYINNLSRPSPDPIPFPRALVVTTHQDRPEYFRFMSTRTLIIKTTPLPQASLHHPISTSPIKPVQANHPCAGLTEVSRARVGCLFECEVDLPHTPHGRSSTLCDCLTASSPCAESSERPPLITGFSGYDRRKAVANRSQQATHCQARTAQVSSPPREVSRAAAISTPAVLGASVCPGSVQSPRQTCSLTRLLLYCRRLFSLVSPSRPPLSLNDTCGSVTVMIRGRRFSHRNLSPIAPFLFGINSRTVYQTTIRWGRSRARRGRVAAVSALTVRRSPPAHSVAWSACAETYVEPSSIVLLYVSHDASPSPP
jgi:hypothetical protein